MTQWGDVATFADLKIEAVRPDELTKQVGNLYERIFSRNELYDEPGTFGDLSWSCIWLAESLPRRVAPYYSALEACAREIGDLRAFMVHEKGPTEGAYSFEWSAERFSAARFRFPLGADIFGASGKWGGVLTDDLIVCIGGSPEFIAELQRMLGGAAHLTREFDEHSRELADGWLSVEHVNKYRLVAGLALLPTPPKNKGSS